MMNRAILLNRLQTAAAIQTARTHLALKRWTPQQRPFADTLIRMLDQEVEALIELGLSEVKLYTEDKNAESVG